VTISTSLLREESFVDLLSVGQDPQTVLLKLLLLSFGLIELFLPLLVTLLDVLVGHAD